MPRKQSAKLLQGTLDMLILKTLALGPLHGYAIARRIAQVTDDALAVEEGTLYPALYRVERQKWVTSEIGITENKQRARFYRLTSAGKKQLQVEEENWERLSSAVTQLMRSA